MIIPGIISCILILYSEHATHVAWWHSGYGIGLSSNRSQVRVPATPLHVTTIDRLFTVTHMCLCSPSSINW